MRLILLNQDAVPVQSQDVEIDKLTAKSIVDATIAARNLAQTIGDTFYYIKLDLKNESVVAGFDGENVLAVFASTPAEVVEAIARFKNE